MTAFETRKTETVTTTLEKATLNDTATENGALMRSATVVAVAVAIVLIAIKLVAYFMTNSVAILSTLVDSMLDLAASFINLIAVRHALVPADREHRYGHGKAEALAGLFQAAVITGSGVFLLFQAAERLYNPKTVQSSDVGIIVMVISILLTIGLVSYQRYVIRRTKSVAITADSLHYLGDVLINGSVMVALILDLIFHLPYVDGLFAVGISLFLLYNSFLIIRASFAELMDEELGEEERANISNLVMAQAGVFGLHDLRTRRSGQHVFIQMHIDMDGSISLRDAHTISEAVETRLMAEYPEAEAIVHQDPIQVPRVKEKDD
ncbi:cation diffusion facilitator family transporter [Sneathiella sp.]|uniref:cation diffusion facilitator family transporter n=1 Tax=Sneathiella sp. TaxID=1964365 RepID=UPI0035628069